jgi:hypothetical protein
MLRTMASLGLTFGAMAWALLASAFVFFYGSSFWIGALGQYGAFWGAFASFVLALNIARSMLRLADKLTEQTSGPLDEHARAIAPNKMPDPPHPRRTSMAGRVTWEENRRAVRRSSVIAPRAEKWGALED